MGVTQNAIVNEQLTAVQHVQPSASHQKQVEDIAEAIINARDFE
jgi:hypothetical protein